MIKARGSGLLTKLVILGLLVYLVISLLQLGVQLTAAREQVAAREKLVTEQRQTNAAIAEDLQRADDPEMQEDIARDKLGLVVPGEQIFVDVTN